MHSQHYLKYTRLADCTMFLLRLLEHSEMKHPVLIQVFLLTLIAESLVETETIGHVFLVGINRPEKRNCVNQATAQLLYEAFKDFENNDDLRVAVLYGKGL